VNLVRRALPWLIALAGLAVGVIAERDAHANGLWPTGRIVADFLAALATLGAGIASWRARPGSVVGPLLTAGAGLWFLVETGLAQEFLPELPALALEQDGRPVAFFDGPGGTQVPQRVIDAVSAYYHDLNANSGGAFATSERNDEMADEAHAAVADLLGAASPDEIKFGANMTTLTLHLGRSIGATLQPGDEIVVTRLDHEANVSTWRAMAADRGVTVQIVDIDPSDVTLDLEDLESKLGPRTKLVAVGYASNAVGSINPVREIVARAHEVGALTFVDAVAYAPHGPIDVVAIDTDFLACSAYKWFGPHVGVLWASAEIHEELHPGKLRPSSDAWPAGPWPQSWAVAAAAVRATFRPAGRAMPTATWATSTAWVRRVRRWSSSGAMKTWHLPARRRNGREWWTRSRSRSKHVRNGSGSSWRARLPAPRARVAPGARVRCSVSSRAWRAPSTCGAGPTAVAW